MTPTVITLISVGGVWTALTIMILFLHIRGKSLDHRITRSCRMHLNQAPEAVYSLLANAPGWPAWNLAVKRVEPLPSVNGKQAYRMFSGPAAMDLVTTRDEPPRVLERTTLEGRKRPAYSGVWLHELTPKDSGCVVTLTENGTIHSPITRVLVRRMVDPTISLKLHLAYLAAHFGENPTIEVVSST